MGIAETVERRKAQETDTKRCKLGQEIQGLGEDDHTAIHYAIDRARQDAKLPQSRRTWTASVVHRILNDNGIEVGITVVKAHIGRACTCDNPE